MERDYYYMMMAIYIMAILKKEMEKEKEFLYMKTIINLLGYLRIIKKMKGKDIYIMKTVTFITDK